MAVSAPPPPTVEIDDGVIEEARRRQRQRRGRIAAVTAVAAILASLALLIGGHGHRGSPIRGAAFRFGPPKLTFVRGFPYLGGQPFPLSVRPYLGAGFAGLDIQTWNVGLGGAGYPQQGTPLFGGDTNPRASLVHAPSGQLDWFLSRPDVAAVRVAGVGTLKPVVLPGLPPGVRAVVFLAPKDVSPVVTPLDASRHPVPISPAIATFPGPTSYFQGRTEVPDNSACLVQSGERSARRQWGLVSTQISSTPQAVGPAFFSCLNAWYTIPGAAIEVGVLLNAQHPGAPPAPLWGSAPVAGHPGLVEMPPVRYRQPGRPAPPASVIATNLMRRRHLSAARAKEIAKRVAASARTPYWITLAPRLVARREGNAWLVVANGSLAQEVGFIKALRITRLDLGQTR